MCDKSMEPFSKNFIENLLLEIVGMFGNSQVFGEMTCHIIAEVRGGFFLHTGPAVWRCFRNY